MENRGLIVCLTFIYILKMSMARVVGLLLYVSAKNISFSEICIINILVLHSMWKCK